MGRQNNRRNTRNSRYNNQPPPVQTQIPSAPVKSKFRLFLDRFWHIITIVIVLISGGVSYFEFADHFRTPEQQHNKDFFYEGDLKPTQLLPGTSVYKSPTSARNYELLPIILPDFSKLDTVHLKPFNGLALKFYNSPFIILYTGLYAFPVFNDDIKKGVRISIPTKNNCEIGSFLDLVVKNNRVYISIEFKDLKNEETIGFIEYNHWKLYKPNLLDFKYDGERKLTVKDKQNNIVFQIDTYGRGVIYLAGYFINEKSITVIPNKLTDTIHSVCIPKSKPDWKVEAQKVISLIKSDFDTPVTDPDKGWPTNKAN